MEEVKPSVHKQMKKRLLPVLETMGFGKEKTGCYSRLVNRIYQFVVFKVETRDRREFIVQYGADFLGQPHEAPTLELGGTFPGDWYPALTEDQLDHSMDDVVEFTRSNLLEWFHRTSVVPDYVDVFNDHLKRTGENPAGYSHFRLACLYADMKDTRKALKKANHARRLFTRAYDDYPTRGWAKIHADYCSLLMDHLQKGNARSVLDQWYADSLSNLGLEEENSG